MWLSELLEYNLNCAAVDLRVLPNHTDVEHIYRFFDPVYQDGFGVPRLRAGRTSGGTGPTSSLLGHYRRGSTSSLGVPVITGEQGEQSEGTSLQGIHNKMVLQRRDVGTRFISQGKTCLSG